MLDLFVSSLALVSNPHHTPRVILLILVCAVNCQLRAAALARSMLDHALSP